MSTTEFWNEEPNLLWTYHSLYMSKIEQRQQEIDYSAWLQGMYICKAIATCFCKGQKYPKEPLYIQKAKTQRQNKIDIANKIKARLDKSKEILDMRGRNKGQKTQ